MDLACDCCVAVRLTATIDGEKIISCSGSGFIQFGQPNTAILASGTWCSQLINCTFERDSQEDIPSVRIHENIVSMECTIYSNFTAVKISDCKVKLIWMDQVFYSLKEKQQEIFQNILPFTDLAILSTIVLLDLKVSFKLFPFLPLPMKNLKTTDTVYSISTPFGGDYFVSYCLNTLSHGHIRKSIDNNLLLVEMQLVYGCEGGLVIALDKNELKFVGMIVVASVNTGDVALVVSSEIIMDLVTIQAICIPTEMKSKANKMVSSEGQYIVFIKCGATSGSGIILSPSIVLTCSHVVKESCQYPVEVKLRECLFTATVLFSASLLDLAILLLHPSLPANTKHLFQLSLPEGIELLGSQVHAIGYHHKSVKVTSGILSKLVCDPDTSVPILIKSNASLHNGMSGGLLVHTETSIPIGMLQFNMKDHASNVAFVSANFSLPLSLILEPIKQLLYDKGFESLKKLDQKINHGKNLLSKL